MLINSDIPLDMPLKNLSAKELDIITYGNNKKIKIDILTTSNTRTERIKVVEGLAQRIERRYLTTKVEMARAWYQKTFMSELNCKKCNGSRLNEYALAVKINNLNIYEFSQLSISQALNFILNLKLNDNEKEIATLIINELVNRLSFLSNVGLEYLTLIRKAETLSGGEAQRIRLATQIGSKLTGILYVLDEPSIGLHQKDNQKLISTLKHMVGIGNTLIVVEHDEETIRSADWIVDIGPLAGDRGGSIVAQGELKDIENESKSITGLFLSNKEKIDIPSFRRKPKKDKKLIITGAKENNLKNIDVEFPLGQIIAVTGVSGSGKSTLINEILAKALNQKLTNPFIKPGNFKEIKGIKNNVDKVIIISQSPIGRTPRSNPATYTSVFNDIRDLFAEVPLARERGYLKGRFSFNVPGGRCDKCYGDGVIEIEMHFLPNVYVKCTSCNGKRFNFETLECKYKNKSIYDVLEMRVSEALEFFENHPKIKEKLQTIVDVGLGYIKLGQNATTISGGEAQRVKLATYLQKKPTGKSIYILDEPTTGLHQYDIKKLLIVLNRLVDNGDTVIVIEHNLDVIKCVDYIIDLGPGGGIYGGQVVAKGTPEEVAKNKKSYTGQFLSEIFNKNKKS
ncbi:MAG: excinuclease ABC subunit A [Mycoplasma sp.]|nr:excinuclease ABC subunit A [Mycoplasma sp.]